LLHHEYLQRHAMSYTMLQKFINIDNSANYSYTVVQTQKNDKYKVLTKFKESTHSSQKHYTVIDYPLKNPANQVTSYC